MAASNLPSGGSMWAPSFLEMKSLEASEEGAFESALDMFPSSSLGDSVNEMEQCAEAVSELREAGRVWSCRPLQPMD